MKTFTLCLASLSLAILSNACGSSKSDSPATSSAAWSDTAMQSIVANNCAVSGCHNGSQRPDYSGISEASMKADTTARDQVKNGLMPQSGAFSDAQRATVANFYAH